jgi:hypothetical protein
VGLGTKISKSSCFLVTKINDLVLLRKFFSLGWYRQLRHGQLIKITQTKSLPLISLLNPWLSYTKAAANGALGQQEKAKRFSRSLFFPFLKKKLAKYLGRTQPALVRELLGPPSPHNTLRIAFELVSGTAPASMPKPLFTKPNPLLQSLWDNRSVPFAQDRVATVNALLKATGGSPVEWAPDGVVQLGFVEPSGGYESSSGDGPLVTVVVTAFNAGALVKQSVQSLLNQTHRHLQILVANDASTDDTWVHLKALAQQDPRVTVFNLPENVGTYAAKSLMLRFAKGEFVVCHDADDLAAPNFVERSLQTLLCNPRKVAVISNWFRVDEELRIFPGAVRRFWPLLSINHSSLMLRTAVLKELGGWDVPRVAADTELFERIRWVYGKRSVVQLPQPLTIGSMRADSLMNDPTVGAMQAQAFRLRVEYREAWVDWHQACKTNRTKPVMPSPLSADRPFFVPAAFRVDPADIAHCWAAMQAQQPTPAQALA